MDVSAKKSSAQAGVVAIPNPLITKRNTRKDHAIIIFAAAQDPLPYLEYAIVFETILSDPVSNRSETIARWYVPASD